MVVFAVPSGAGKSTLVNLIDPRDGRRRLSDDRMVLHLAAGAARAFGTPWPGEAEVAASEGGPLRALCLLRHADRTLLKRLRPAAALARLLPVISVAWYEPALMHRTLDLVDRLLRQVPTFELAFRPQRSEVADVIDRLEAGSV